MPDLHTRLRDETSGIHTQLEALPFFDALRAGALPAVSIVSFLGSLAIIHDVLERAVQESHSPSVVALGHHAVPKVPLLMADLAALGADEMPSITPAIEVALEYGAEILTGAGDASVLTGALYVLEGSQNGGVMLRQAYARCLQVPVEQITYFGCYGPGTAAHWRSFVGQLNALPFDDALIAGALGSATRCFEQLARLCAALHPYAAADLRHHVSTINREAGDHVMPQDPRAVALALRAGREAWVAFPYLAERFGDRGRRFTGSDSCWLVAQTRMSVAAATRNLEWLRTVLSSRGIPTVILERHLHLIARGLSAEWPGEPDLPARFQPFLSRVDDQRRTVGGDALAILVAQFTERLRACPGHTVPDAASLLASAWLDERAGIRGALASTRSWFSDPTRFSDQWIAEITSLVSALDASGSTP